MFRSTLMVAVVAALAASSVWADDIVPAPWRGDGLYTFQEWEFHDPGVIPPDGELPTINPNGTPLVFPGTGVIWTSDFDLTGLDGYVGTGGTGSYLEFEVPNYIDFEPIKYLRVQINGIWSPSIPPSVIGITAIDNEVGPSVSVGFDGSDETFPGFHRWEDWHIIPNPDFETILIDVPANAFVNQVVIETTSIPEPASLGLLACGGLMLCRRRRS